MSLTPRWNVNVCNTISLPLTSKWTLSKKPLYECKQQPNSISTTVNKNKLPTPKFVSLIAGIVDLYFRISPWIFVKNRIGPLCSTQGPRENWFMKKNLKSQISCQTPFKLVPIFILFFRGIKLGLPQGEFGGINNYSTVYRSMFIFILCQNIILWFKDM